MPLDPIVLDTYRLDKGEKSAWLAIFWLVPNCRFQQNRRSQPFHF